jgi:hypothetical protein
MSEGDRGRDAFDKLLAIARELGQSIERAAEQLDLNDIADRLESGGGKLREFAEFAGQRISEQSAPGAEPHAGADEDVLPRPGPHPLDMPTEEQALVLSALDSGRWQVKPGTDELVSAGEGPSPSERIGLVSELRARDWIAASGEVTAVGRAALERWGARPRPSS